MKVYVVYWVDLDRDVPKQSIIKILGVVKTKKDAENLKYDWEYGKNEGWEYEDHFFTAIYECELNVVAEDIRNLLYIHDI